jgi:hypothetical protein
MEAGQVSVRLHSSGPQGAKLKAEVVADILASLKERGCKKTVCSCCLKPLNVRGSR